MTHALPLFSSPELADYLEKLATPDDDQKEVKAPKKVTFTRVPTDT